MKKYIQLIKAKRIEECETEYITAPIALIVLGLLIAGVQVLTVYGMPILLNIAITVIIITTMRPWYKLMKTIVKDLNS